MDINAYISSGILQEYALGHISDQERSEVECMSKIYPEIREALTTSEIDLESFAAAYAVKSPSKSRENILVAVKRQAQDSTIHSVTKDDNASETKEILIQSEVTERKSAWGGWAAAAAVIAIAIAVWQYTDNQASKDELQALKVEQNTLENKTAELETRVAQLSDGLNEVYSSSVKKVTLKSVKENNTTQLALLWNTETGEVKLNTSALPKLPSDKQYQLWVLKDGKPKDMGVLSKTEEGILIASNATKDGDTFAITIEPLGGKASPSLDQLVVMGAIS
ncbi:anti-sigma factor [Cryomorpha ignava]|uniref:Anti-sigma factor n=1 Tax=Cryomorpha ignava TaxID=101383 RepID=A0A7K3WV27_9FLAO|nr:anti-sigma factor [Cryomorpha ignava]NEN25507.1 anti-sigma factor [Cryomorpha ignava]